MSIKAKEKLKIHCRNQLHTPKKKFDETQKVKMFLKCKYSTMLVCKDLTSLQATSLALYIKRFLKSHNTKLEGEFIQTR